LKTSRLKNTKLLLVLYSNLCKETLKKKSKWY